MHVIVPAYSTCSLLQLIIEVPCFLLPFLRQLENELQNKQLGGTFPRKRQSTPEKSERHGSTREEDRVENVAGGTRDLIYHHPQVC